MRKFKTTIKTTDKNIIEDIKRYNGVQHKNLWIIYATTKYEKEQNDNNRIFKAYVIKEEEVSDKKILSKDKRITRFREKFQTNDTKTTDQYGSVEWWVNGMNEE